MKTKAKKEKKVAGEGFELWNELDVQRIKFMVRTIVDNITTSNTL